jgi:hypothetical protein
MVRSGSTHTLHPKSENNILVFEYKISTGGFATSTPVKEKA